MSSSDLVRKASIKVTPHDGSDCISIKVSKVDKENTVYISVQKGQDCPTSFNLSTDNAMRLMQCLNDVGIMPQLDKWGCHDVQA